MASPRSARRPGPCMSARPTSCPAATPAPCCSRALSDPRGQWRGRQPDRHRRPQLSRPPRRIFGRDLRPLPSAHPRGLPRRAGEGPQFRRPSRRRGEARRSGDERFNLDLVRFTNSGTEANMMALAAARCFTGRREDHADAGRLSRRHALLQPRRLARERAVRLRVGRIQRRRGHATAHRGERRSSWPRSSWNRCWAAAAASRRAANSSRCCARKPRRAASLLIFDEVMTSRLHPGGLSARLGIEPDLKTLGKYMGGGMSFGAFGGRRDIMALFDPAQPDALPHAGTFNNNTLTMAVGSVAMTEIYTPEACAQSECAGRPAARKAERPLHALPGPDEGHGPGLDDRHPPHGGRDRHAP